MRNTMIKRTLFILVFALLFLFGGQLRSEATTRKWEIGKEIDTNITATLDDNGVLNISGSGDMKAWDSGNQPPWDDYDSDIKKVIINSGVTNIGKNAFNDCGNLYYVNYMGGMDNETDIGESAFTNCSNLVTVQFSKYNNILKNYCEEKKIRMEEYR